MNKVLKIPMQESTKDEAILKILKKGIWLYFFLLIFEGALRKWFLPFLAAPLLVVRDPVAIWLIYMAWKHNVVKANMYVLLMTFFTIIAICTALIFGHGSMIVALYGARITLIHFPVIFIIGKVFNQEDVIKMGRVLLLIAIPMTVLIALQFYSPQSAWVNRGIGGDIEGGGFSGAMGYFRPPATFSFISGTVMFYSLVACFVFYFWLSKVEINRLILIGATVGLIASIPLSISRTLAYTLGLTFVFTLISVANKPKFFVRMLGFIILGLLVLAVLSQTPLFKTGTEVLATRFDIANDSEGGMTNSIMDRVFGGMLSAVENSNNLPFFGQGLGMGTNAGAAMLTGGRSTFLIAEDEWPRLVGEMGFVLGVFILLIRVIFSAEILIRSYSRIKMGNILPWLLLSMGFLIILRGQWAQPTVLGFSTLVGGLILAAVKNDPSQSKTNI